MRSVSFGDLRARLPGNRVRARNDGYQLAHVLSIHPDLATCDVMLQDGRVLKSIDSIHITRREIGDIVRVRRSEGDGRTQRAMITRLPTRSGQGVANAAQADSVHTTQGQP